MKVVRCENNHFFDLDEYEKCPECGASVKASANNESQKSKKGLFSKFRKAPHEVTTTVTTNFTQNYLKIKEEKETRKKEPEAVSRSRDGKTIGYFDPFENDSKTEKAPVQETPTDAYFPTEQLTDDVVEVSEESVQKQEKQEKIIPVAPSLAESLKKVSASDDGKTMGYFESRKKEETHIESEHTDPVVGWLVAVKGALFGKAYNIYSGNNSVGRNETNTIVLSGDQTISRKSHTCILYEPRKRLFYVKAGDERGIVYVNNEPLVTGAIEAKYKDRITIGNSDFILVPLCGESFSWEDYIEEE